VRSADFGRDAGVLGEARRPYSASLTGLDAVANSTRRYDVTTR
jgi:hypothetical protein